MLSEQVHVKITIFPFLTRAEVLFKYPLITLNNGHDSRLVKGSHRSMNDRPGQNTDKQQQKCSIELTNSSTTV